MVSLVSDVRKCLLSSSAGASRPYLFDIGGDMATRNAAIVQRACVYQFTGGDWLVNFNCFSRSGSPRGSPTLRGNGDVTWHVLAVVAPIFLFDTRCRAGAASQRSIFHPCCRRVERIILLQLLRMAAAALHSWPTPLRI